MASDKKKPAGAEDKKDLKAILTAPIGGKKGRGKSAKGKTTKGGAKGKATGKDFTTYDAIRHQKLKLRQEDDIKTFLSRAVLLIGVIVALFSLLFGFHAQKDNSMAPKLSSGDLLLYYRLDDDFKTQDVVVYEKNGKVRSGRVVAKAGDSVDIPEDGGLIINGSQMIETDIFYSTGRREDGMISYPLTLSVNQVFVLGDYREGAEDSRTFGPVNKAEIKGKVITVLRRSGL